MSSSEVTVDLSMDALVGLLLDVLTGTGIEVLADVSVNVFAVAMTILEFPVSTTLAKFGR